MRSVRLLGFITVFFVGLLCITSCNKRRYPCPGGGTSSHRELSLFDEDGNLKSEKGKKSKKDERGLINKKQDVRLKARRKQALDDKPKHMKK